MKYAILSDIHGNADALEVVLAKCRELKIEKFISLGDIVGYNAEPKKCVAMCRELDIIGKVRGNHDEYAAESDDREISGFNAHARRAVLWTREQLDKEEKEFVIKDVPYRTALPGITTTLVHATLDSPESWGYVFDVHHARDNFVYQFTPYCFCGHSHVPVAFRKRPVNVPGQGAVEEITEWVTPCENGVPVADFSRPDQMVVELKGGNKYLFNIGSVGQPRNHDPRSSFAVMDTEERTVTRYLLPYDVAAAQAKVIAAGLPERLAARLAYGI